MAVVRDTDDDVLGVENADDTEDVVDATEAVEGTYAGKDVVTFAVAELEVAIDADEAM